MIKIARNLFIQLQSNSINELHKRGFSALKNFNFKSFWYQSRFTNLAILGFTSSIISIPADAVATTPKMTQVTAVSQLSEVTPSGWENQALRGLVERYGCIAGYADGTYRGNATLRRYEFAAGMLACLTQINAILAASTNTITAADLVTLQRLQAEFAQELATLQGRVDTLEVRAASLEAQHSNTTKLEGQAIFALIAPGGNRKADGSGDVDRNVTLSNRARLNFNTSFSSKDRLRIRLQARNIPETATATGTEMASLGFDGSNDNEVEVSRLDYYTAVGDRGRVYVSLVGGGLGDFVPTINPLLSSSGDGSISTFGRENPIRRQGGAPGISFEYEFSDAISFAVGFAASDADNPEVGILQSAYGAIAQLTIQPTETLTLGLTYIRSDNSIDTDTGSELAADPFDDEADAISANSYGVEAAYQLSPAFTLGGRVGLLQATAQDLSAEPTADIFTWAVTLAFPDLFGEGNLAGVVVGLPPKVIDNDLDTDLEDEDNALHLEAFYRLRVNDHIAVTPGFFIITNPEHDRNNDPVYVGTIRTTFEF